MTLDGQSLDNLISYSSLLDWWLNHNPELINRISSSAISICKQLDEISHREELTFGFEFHHYIPDRPADLLIYSDTSILRKYSSLPLPPWWNDYHNLIMNSHSIESVQFLKNNWLEFDYVSNQMKLNGIWQSLSEKKKIYSYQSWLDLVKYLDPIIPDLDSDMNCLPLKQIIEHFSIPQQIGFMFGRNYKLKFMIQLKNSDQLLNFQQFIIKQDNNLQLKFRPIVECLLQYGVKLKPGISFDINIANNELNPENISIEIHQPHQLGRKLQPETKSFINCLSPFDSFQLVELQNFLDILPYGESLPLNPFSKASPLITNISRLNHLKFTLKSGSWQLKSYIKLVQTSLH